MYGRYTKDLGEYAKDEARRLKQLERQRKKDDRARDKVNDETLSARTLQSGISDEYIATVLGISRNFSAATGTRGRFFEPFRGVGGTRSRGWEKIGYS